MEELLRALQGKVTDDHKGAAQAIQTSIDSAKKPPELLETAVNAVSVRVGSAEKALQSASLAEA